MGRVMTLEQFHTFAQGAFLLMCFLALLVRIILSSEDQPNYPAASFGVQGWRFFLSLGLLYVGIETIHGALSEPPVYVSEARFFSGLFLCGLFVTETLEHMRTWLPESKHAWIRRMIETARCGGLPGTKEARAAALKNTERKSGVRVRAAPTHAVPAALLLLHQEGVNVIPPNAGPSALLQSQFPTPEGEL